MEIADKEMACRFSGGIPFLNWYKKENENMKKATKTAAKKATAKKASAKVAKKAAPKKAASKVAKKAAVKKTPAKKAAKKAAASKGSKTVIEAITDIGFGNLLYIRGDAPGLSWKNGVPMDCKGSNSWSLSLSDVKSSFEFKVLINDIHWAVGGNEIAKPGVTNTTEPSF